MDNMQNDSLLKKILTLNPNQSPLYNITPRIGLPIKSNVIEVNGRFRLKYKCYMGSRGIISSMNNDNSNNWVEA